MRQVRFGNSNLVQLPKAAIGLFIEFSKALLSTYLLGVGALEAYQRLSETHCYLWSFSEGQA